MADQEQSSSTAMSSSACRKCRIALLSIVLLLVLALGYLGVRFGLDSPVEYADIEEHFKYGSTGGERNLGFPYWIWQAAPLVCADKFPAGADQFLGYQYGQHKEPLQQSKEAYKSFGMIYEQGSDGKEKDLPVGVSKRRHLGLDRVFLNCAVCHTSTVRDTPEEAPRLVLGMPANTFNLMDFSSFFFECAKDYKFQVKWIIPEIERLGADLDLIDRYLVYPLAIWLMQERVQHLANRLGIIGIQRRHGWLWGPGRVDTFNSAKGIFNWQWNKASERELIGITDFPAIWNQRQRKEPKQMNLHWDGNNKQVEERNLSAAFGTGAQPPIADHAAIGRIEDWLLDFGPPNYPYAVDEALANRGAPIYQRYCARCHGASGREFTGELVGEVTPIEEIGTDRWRLDSYTYELAVNQGNLYTGYEQHRFKNFRKTYGYANMPLDGIWLRAPYLHNGSVPTLRDLLEPNATRPRVFYRGNDIYDSENVGFVSDVADRRFFRFDTGVLGNSNAGHEGKEYGTELSAEEKRALIEYLKTF